jgi:HIRAN domain
LETLELDHEDDNPHDPNAVRVSRKTGEQLGYLRAELAAEIVSKSEHGYQFVVFITDITGDERKAALSRIERVLNRNL